jgi:hypothetical protein
VHFFIATIYLPSDPEEDFWKTIPEHRARINTWMMEGIIQVYSLASDRSKLWVIFYATDRNKVESYIQKMPLYHYFEDYEVNELAFHNNVSMMPVMSLN